MIIKASSTAAGTGTSSSTDTVTMIAPSLLNETMGIAESGQ